MTMFRTLETIDIWEYPATVAELEDIKRAADQSTCWYAAVVIRALWEAEHPAADARPLVPVEEGETAGRVWEL